MKRVTSDILFCLGWVSEFFMIVDRGSFKIVSDVG